MKEQMITTIRVKQGTKDVLDSLKIIDREPYDSVILRALQYMLEDHLELSNSTKELLKKRIDNIGKGEVLSTEDLLKKIREKRGKENAK